MQNSKLKAQNYNSKPTSFKLVAKILTFDFCVLTYLQTGGFY